MRFMILGGSGIQGSASARDLLEMNPDAEVILIDTDQEALQETAEWLDSGRVHTRICDVTDKKKLINLIEEFDCGTIISSVPWKVSIPPLEAAIKAEANFIDYGLYQNREFEERMSEFNKKAKKSGVTVIPSCGVAPGLTNMLAAFAAAKLDQVEKVHIYVGGIPEKPKPPLQYSTVWSLEGVWTQFFEETRVVKEGELTTVDAGTGLETLSFPETGELEAACTDGLGTLIHMYEHPVFDGVEEVFEKTIRYPGHYEKVMTLKACGLLDTNPIEVDGTEISPREFLTTLLNPKLTMEEDERDMTVLRVRVTGAKEEEDRCFVYDMVDYRDLESGIYSMGRTTGYTGSILAPIVEAEKITETGVVEPEKLGADEELFETLLDEYEKRDIQITQK